MSDDNGVKRDEKGRVVAGGANLHKNSTRVRAKVVSRALKREFIRRYENKPIEEGSTEVMGKERAKLAHYFYLMDIMEDANQKGGDRIKAIAELANRMDGKPVETIDLQGEVETGSPLDKAVAAMTPEQLLELIRAARGH